MRTKKKLEMRINKLEQQQVKQKNYGIGIAGGLGVAQIVAYGAMIGQRMSIKKCFEKTWEKMDNCVDTYDDLADEEID